jgi:hypothetical protein
MERSAPPQTSDMRDVRSPFAMLISSKLNLRRFCHPKRRRQAMQLFSSMPQAALPVPSRQSSSHTMSSYTETMMLNRFGGPGQESGVGWTV